MGFRLAPDVNTVLMSFFLNSFQRIEDMPVTQALIFNLPPKTFKRSVDGSQARFNGRGKPLRFLDILNSEDPSMEYTTEFDFVNKQLSVLDVTITNTCKNSYDFKIFQKTSIRNVQMKSSSSIAPHIAMGVFKGFLSLAYKICTEKYLQSEIDFLIIFSQRMDKTEIY